MNPIATAIKRAWWYVFEESNEIDHLIEDKNTNRKERRYMKQLRNAWQENGKQSFKDLDDFVEHSSYIPLVQMSSAELLRELIFVAAGQFVKKEAEADAEKDGGMGTDGGHGAGDTDPMGGQDVSRLSGDKPPVCDP